MMYINANRMYLQHVLAEWHKVRSNWLEGVVRKGQLGVESSKGVLFKERVR